MHTYDMFIACPVIDGRLVNLQVKAVRGLHQASTWHNDCCTGCLEDRRIKNWLEYSVFCEARPGS